MDLGLTLPPPGAMDQVHLNFFLFKPSLIPFNVFCENAQCDGILGQMMLFNSDSICFLDNPLIINSYTCGWVCLLAGRGQD